MILKTIIIEFSTKKQRYKKLPRKARPTEKKKVQLSNCFRIYV